jgi:hypothetical protein
MSSIGSTINAVNSSILSQIDPSFTTPKSTSTVASAPGVPQDRVDFSEIAQVMKDLSKLQSTDPARFKQVLSDAATQFQNAAGKETDPEKAKLLHDLANRFQQAADSGDLSALAPQQKTVHGHHRHHHAAYQPPPADSATSTDVQSVLINALKSNTSTAGTSTN